MSFQRSCYATKAASGKVTFLRVHDAGTGFGPPTDFIDVEVVIGLDSIPGQFFGFRLRNDAKLPARQGMLDLLRDAFDRNLIVNIDFFQNDRPVFLDRALPGSGNLGIHENRRVKSETTAIQAFVIKPQGVCRAAAAPVSPENLIQPRNTCS